MESSTKNAYTTLWGCGPDFDNAILQAAFGKVGLPWPFHYAGYRDYRTVKDIGDRLGYERPVREGCAHNALEDAAYEAEVTVAILRKLGVSM